MRRSAHPTNSVEPESHDLLGDLNDEQRASVTHGHGPLLIVAGAGTGKTKTLTHRIAWLIKQGLAKPSEILALTFTDKAAGEMESRVDQLLPYGQTDTTITTFHAFGDQLLRIYALDLDLPPEYRVLSQTEQELFLADRFDDIEDLIHLRPITNPRKFISLILQVISRAKDELITPDQYAAVAQTLRDQATTDEARIKAEGQVEIATIYAAYESFKAERGVIDFGDQILFLHRLLSARPGIRAKLQDQYRYILVDEFQDTNVAQYQLVKQLLTPASNLTVVCDDDQAIYKFRGAAISNIVGFLKDFPAAEQRILTKNYRSTQAILDTSYRLIQYNNPDRLETTLGLAKRLTGTQPGQPPTLHWYWHETDELAELIRSIETLKKSGRSNRDIAILVRSNALIGTVAMALRRAGLPYTTSRDTGFINQPAVRGIVAFFQSLVWTDDSLSLLRLALGCYYQLAAEWVLPLNDVARQSHQPLNDVLSNEASVAWSRVPNKGQAALRSLRADLIRYRQLIGTKNPGEILYQFLYDRGVLADHRSDSPQAELFTKLPEAEQLDLIQTVATVFEAISGYLQAGRDPFSLTFVDQLNGLLSTLSPPTVTAGPDLDAVSLMTVHAAKGLEFPIVFLPSLMADRFPARRHTNVIDLPDELITEELPSGDEHLEEERRLMYVAMTRARDELHFSGSERVGSGNRVKKISPFVLEALALERPPTPIQPQASTEQLAVFAPKPPITPTITYPRTNGILFLSPAAIETYLIDPYNFYWKYVLKAPQPPSRHLVYGNAIHSAIEAYYHARRSLIPRSIDESDRLLDTALQRYAEAWKSEGFASQADENRQFTHGREILQRFIKRAATEPLPEFVEHTFKLGLPGVKVSGRIDALFTTAGEIRDFKTSQVKDQKDADRKIRNNFPIRIYALAFQQQFGRLPSALVLDFVEFDLKASLTPTESLLDETKDLIAQAVAGITANRFDPNPNNAFRDYEDA